MRQIGNRRLSGYLNIYQRYRECVIRVSKLIITNTRYLYLDKSARKARRDFLSMENAFSLGCTHVKSSETAKRADEVQRRCCAPIGDARGGASIFASFRRQDGLSRGGVDRRAAAGRVLV